MTKNYYAVTAKCGHVGRGKYVIKTFAVKAEDGKEAAKQGRMIPRVKHDNKHCILDVKKITEEQFILLIEENNKDQYFKCSNVQEQRKKCPEIYDEVFYLYGKKELKDRKDKVNKKKKINEFKEFDSKMMLKDYMYDLAIV